MTPIQVERAIGVLFLSATTLCWFTVVAWRLCCTLKKSAEGEK